MAKKEFSNLNDLFKHIENDIAKSLRQETLETVKEQIVESVRDEVYHRYSPTLYERRIENDGLGDIRNIEYEDISKTEIDIRNYTRTNPRYGGGNEYVDQYVVSGVGYDWKDSEIYKMMPYPRDFYGDATEKLNRSGEHIETFKQSMKKKGYDID